MCLTLTSLPPILQMFNQFLLLLVFGSLCNGFRTLYRDLFKAGNYSFFQLGLLFYVCLKLFEINMPQKWASTSNIIAIDVISTLLMSAMILMFSLRAIDVAELIDNYLSYIQDVYFQIVNQNTQIIRANQNVINDDELIAVNKQIIKA
jgi:hypothetical protein